MTYKQSILKRRIEAIFAWPFVFLGKLMSPLFPLKSKHELFIFCPSADIGGANKVNADLASVFADKSPLVIFSKKPKNNEFLDKFKIDGVTIIDLHKQLDHKLYHFVNVFYRGIIASWINRSGNPVVIGGESLYFFKVLPYLKKNIKTIEISHLDTWFNFTQAFIKNIDGRVFSTAKLKRDAEELYRKNNLPVEYYSRLHFIDNMVEIPTVSSSENNQMEVVFIGRGSPQKRVHLVAAIAQKLHTMDSPIHFSFVGDVEKVIDIQNYPFCTFYGNVRERKQMESIYRKSDVLLLTSAFEGLPVAVMEMMAYGKTIVSTAVNAIPDYIINGVNGFLIKNHGDETGIVSEAVEILLRLQSDPLLRKRMGENNYQYARDHFSRDAFKRKWEALISKK